MNVYNWKLGSGITRTKAFEEKRLAAFAVNCGLKCGHGCTYCSTGAVLRMHKAFGRLQVSPFKNDYAIVDPDTHVRVARDAVRLKRRGLVQLCTFVDAWCPAAQKYDTGRRCLEAILNEKDWTVRILTKNSAIREDFDVIERHRDRVLFGVSITATPDKADVMSRIEPNASPIEERISVMREAHERGFRTYAMYCPLLAGIADSPSQIEELVALAAEVGAEEIFVEPVNARGAGLRLTQTALEEVGYSEEAAAIQRIRNRKTWSQYARELIFNTQRSVRRLHRIESLRFLLYPSLLEPEDATAIKRDDEGVVWLGKV